MSVFKQRAWVYVDLLGIAFSTPLGLDPIVFSAAESVLSGFNFDEEVTGMEVTVRV